MLPGKPITAAFGQTGALILTVKASEVAGALRAVVFVRPEYAERYFALWINEVYIGNYWCDEDAIFEAELPPNFGGLIGSFFIMDVGMWAKFDEADLPYLNWHAEAAGALTSQNLVQTWTEPTPVLSTVYGDTQLSSITITGARRGINVEDVPEFATRGRLRYSLLAVSTYYYLRWWVGETLVAEGVRNGSGAVVCNEIEGSGLTINATITFTGDVEKSDAWIDLKWPAIYQIHYSTATLTYPRTPEDEVLDNGGESYSHAVYGLAPGVYNFNVITVDDEGNIQTSISTPADSPLTILAQPLKPTITGVTGSAAAGLTVAFTNGEAGCTYTLYYSTKNEPINFGDLGGAYAPVVTALNATSATTAPIVDVTATNHETAYNTLVGSIDSSIATCNSVFVSSGPGFIAAFAALATAIDNALAAFSLSTGYPVREKRQQVADNAAAVTLFLTDIDSALSGTSEWLTQAGIYYGNFLAFIGVMLDGNQNSWTLPNGSLAGSLGGADTAGSASTDGELGQSVNAGATILELVTPFVRNAKFYLIVRATKSGVEEKNGAAYEIELSAAGAIVATRPNKAQLESVTIAGLDVSVIGGVADDDEAVAATHLELYIYTGSISIGSPDDVVALPSSGVNGYRTAQFGTQVLGGAGWYKIAVFALTTAGGRSLLYDEHYVQIDTAVPTSVLNLRGFVARNKGR